MKKPKIPGRAHLPGFGATAIGIAALGPIGVLTYQDTKDTGKINCTPKKSDLVEGTLTSIYFANEAAVTREIKRLQRLRKVMREVPATKPIKITVVEKKSGAI
jgi:hypothetical protein